MASAVAATVVEVVSSRPSFMSKGGNGGRGGSGSRLFTLAVVSRLTTGSAMDSLFLDTLDASAEEYFLLLLMFSMRIK